MEQEKEETEVKVVEEKKIRKQKKENYNLKMEKGFESPLVYVGPTFPDKTISKGQIFKGELPTYLKKVIEEDAVFKNLFIDVTKLAEFNVKVSLKGTKEYYFYQNALKKIKERKY